MRRRLIVVSNRGPVTYAPDGTATRGAGGLVTALRGLVEHHDVTWIASAMSDGDRTMAERSGDRAFDDPPYRLRLVRHTPEAYDAFYNVVANPLLWFAQHYLWGLGEAPDWDERLHAAWSDGYAVVNRSFAGAVLDELESEPGAAVLFHDYHLYLAPALVRERAPGATLAHFVHIPWPQPDYWRVLPEEMRRAVHEGLLANDVVAFHTERWAANFRLCCLDVLGAEPDALVAAHAISVDPGEFAELARGEDVLAAEAEIVRSRPEHLVLRVDRTDLSKNVVRGIRSYGLFLERHPELRGRVRMLALLDPSRQDIPEYAAYTAAIERAAGEVRERFGEAALELRIADDFPLSVAAYKQFDVLLVNAVFDGMNLVAKEAPLVNERDGVLVLSESTGASEELGEYALTVNPFDLVAQAEAIHAAVTMPADERRRRIDGIRSVVREHDVGAWIEALLADLDRVTV